jgi:ferrous iron transport protein B
MTNELRVALAGNANVGKSVIFNQLTGLNQVTGNWPGKTVEKAEGKLHYSGYEIRVVDLPGIYSLSAFSIEEVVSRDYLAVEKPDVVVNVIDASALERNLYLTLQLLELELPLVVALNQVDFAAKKGIRVDVARLSAALGVPVVPTVATSGTGIDDLLTRVVAKATSKEKSTPVKIRYGKEIETVIAKVAQTVSSLLPQLCAVYPARWVAIKLLEKDRDIIGRVSAHVNGPAVLNRVETLVNKLEKVHGEESPVIFASERYSLASKIAREVIRIETPPRISLEETLASITTHKVLGYLILAGVLAATFTVIFAGGNMLSTILESAFSFVSETAEAALSSILSPFLSELIVKGVVGGVIAGVTIALPYIVPFYVILALLEDSGYLPRAAFLMDNVMHKMGLHGKAFIPLILGYGCSVPACIGCRIMETERERLTAAFVVMLIPCAARTVVILGLVGRYVGLQAALALYGFDLLLVFAFGRLAFKVLPGEPSGLIMEMPPYKKPTFKSVLFKTWSRTKDFIYFAFPIIIVGSFVVEALALSGVISVTVQFLSPLMTGWLGLPAVTAVPLIFGFLRKELALILLSEALSTVSMSIQSLTSIQMVVFTLVVMLYIPCLATVATCWREFGWKKTLYIALATVGLAFLLGGLAFRLLSLFNALSLIAVA